MFESTFSPAFPEFVILICTSPELLVFFTTPAAPFLNIVPSAVSFTNESSVPIVTVSEGSAGVLFCLLPMRSCHCRSQSYMPQLLPELLPGVALQDFSSL